MGKKEKTMISICPHVALCSSDRVDCCIYFSVGDRINSSVCEIVITVLYRSICGVDGVYAHPFLVTVRTPVPGIHFLVRTIPHTFLVIACKPAAVSYMARISSFVAVVVPGIGSVSVYPCELRQSSSKLALLRAYKEHCCG